jgi:Flp pilus assembly protein TadD
MSSIEHDGAGSNGASGHGGVPHLEAEDVRALADLGFIALSRGLDTHAEAIFAGVSAARPEQEVGAIGSALVLMLRGDVEGAIAALRKLGPGDHVQAFLGLALARQGMNDEARDILSDVARHAPDSPIGELARGILAAQGLDRMT